MLFRRSPNRKNPMPDDGGNVAMPIYIPRGTTKRGSISLSIASPAWDGDTRNVLIMITMVTILVLLAIVATSMAAHDSGSPLIDLQSAIKERPHFTNMLNAEKFPWKTMHRPARAVSPKHHVESFSVQNEELMTSQSTNFQDKSLFYAELRNSYESFFPPNHRHRSLEMVKDLQLYQLSPRDVPGYDIFDCPDVPPSGYPMQWPLWNDVLAHWPVDEMEPPASHTVYQGLCIFDYEKDYDKAIRYRNAELPFVIRGDPAVAQTVERWNTPYYLEALLGDVKQGAEYSENSDFLFWTGSNTRHDANWRPPTQHLEMTYSEWMEKANLTDDKLLEPGMPHYYWKVVGCAASSSSHGTHHTMPCSILSGGEHVPYLTDEMPFYTQEHSSLYIKETVEGAQTKAINCRFGMKGVKATNHFDGERNFVTVFQGVRRMILAHPNQCSKLSLYPPGHPSARHSRVDWSDPDFSQFPEFEGAMANEVVLQPGDSLFLPSLWFHFIVSLSLNIQCNTRSGLDSKHFQDIDACGWA